MTDTIERDPDAIERDIRRTQENMSSTIDRIGDQLTPRKLLNALLDKADENDVDARALLDGARRNPIALGLIAAGAIWLMSDKDSTFPTLRSQRGSDNGHVDPYHRDYVDYMSSVQMGSDEDTIAYQRRRDAARANYLMVERRHDEDDSSFRQRLDDLTDKFREKRHAWVQSSEQVREAAGRGVSHAADKAQNLFDSNPFVGGLIAAAVGAALGSLVPLSQLEQEQLGALGEKARDMVRDQQDALTDKLREKKDELVDQADETLQHKPQGGQQQGQPDPDMEPVPNSPGTPF